MVDINGETWRIVLVSPNHPILYHNNIFTLGRCDDLKKIIFINQDINDQLFKKVLLHELIHAYIYSNNIKINKVSEEIVADLISICGEDIINITNEICKHKNKGSL